MAHQSSLRMMATLDESERLYMSSEKRGLAKDDSVDERFKVLCMRNLHITAIAEQWNNLRLFLSKGVLALTLHWLVHVCTASQIWCFSLHLTTSMSETSLIQSALLIEQIYIGVWSDNTCM